MTTAMTITWWRHLQLRYCRLSLAAFATSHEVLKAVDSFSRFLLRFRNLRPRTHVHNFPQTSYRLDQPCQPWYRQRGQRSVARARGVFAHTVVAFTNLPSWQPRSSYKKINTLLLLQKNKLYRQTTIKIKIFRGVATFILWITNSPKMKALGSFEMLVPPGQQTWRNKVGLS